MRYLMLSVALLCACSSDPEEAQTSLDLGTDTRLPDADINPDTGDEEDASHDADVSQDMALPEAQWMPLAWEDCEGIGRVLTAGPDDYRTVLDTLEPGDTLQLRPGQYSRGLPMRRSGEEGRCIVVEAQNPSDRPVFLGSNAFNILAIHGASWIKLRNFDIDIQGLGGFGVASQGGTESPTHHVVLEGLRIFGFGEDQQISGISTKSPASDWVIRGNHIEGAGTGLYLGNSDGRQPFVRGLIERNTVINPKGYCMQIKHQIERPAGLPENAQTIIRHNVFSKSLNASTGGNARPNLLLGHFPTSGSGQDDQYWVYGNFFYDNPTENLLQAEGNLTIYANIFVNPRGGAVSIQRHNDVPRSVDFLFNTVLSSGTGVSLQGGDPAFTQRARFNAVFAGTPLRVGNETGNITGNLEDADRLLKNAQAAPGSGLDVHPREFETFAVQVEGVPNGANLDFFGRARPIAVAGALGQTSGPALTLTSPALAE